MPTVREFLKRKGSIVHTIERSATVTEAARRMNENHVGALCVVDGGAIVGMFTERDVLIRVVAGQRDPTATTVAEVMSAPVITTDPDAGTADCAALMTNRRIRHLPVLEGGKLVGMISTGDLLAMEVALKQAHIDHLHDYLHGRR
jgi:CBS domain-containing protein